MHTSQHLDAGRKADLASDPNHCKAHQIDPAIQTLQALRAERVLFGIAAQAIDASQRPCFDPDYGVPTTHPLDPRNDSMDDDSFTSLQPLGDASVLVVYSFDGNTDLSIDGVMLGGEFVHIDNFTSHVRGVWFRAIRAEERKAAEIEGWGK